MIRRTLSATATALALIVTLSACSEAPDAPAPVAGDTTSASDAITIADPWVKAAPDGMSAAFGELHNASDADVTLTGVTTEASSDVELHETVMDDAGAMVMRPVADGFVIPADGARLLEPGGDHIMLMSLDAPLVAGADVEFTLTFDDGSTLLVTAPVKDFAGANESYDSHGEHGENDDHSEHEH